MEFVSSSTDTIESLVERTPQLKAAYRLAEKAHKGQERIDGTPYIAHPRAVDAILYEEWGIADTEILAAGILHDTVEDTKVTLEQIRREFGERVASLVDGVTKFVSPDKETTDRETKKKVLDRGFLDPNVDLIKLADRLHNMRTMANMPEIKQIAKSNETLNVYAPLAGSIGMWKVKTELENLAFKYADPQNYEACLQELSEDARTKKIFYTYMESHIAQVVRELGIDASVGHRLNSLVRLKDKREKSLLTDINDLISFRVVVNADGGNVRNQVYSILGALRENFRDIEDPELFSDSYASPKDNNYSAIHITLNTPTGAVEIAITSSEKEEFNDWGIVSLIRRGEIDLRSYSLKLVFTPTGKARVLTPKANGVDFAYSITDDFGNRADSIEIDGVPHSITEVIPHGAVVKVELSRSRVTPIPGLENYAEPPARKRIEKQRKIEAQREFEKVGQDMIKPICQAIGLTDLADISELDQFSVAFRNFLYGLGCKGSLNNLYYQIGSGKMKIDFLKTELEKGGFTNDNLGISSILLEGTDSPGLLEMFSLKVSQLGCNILANRGKGGGTFIQRFVVERLSESQKIELEGEFLKDSRITKVIVV